MPEAVKGEFYMDLRTLSYFVTVAEELNITKAAEKLHMSQPPLSAQIKALEKELNTTLFIRGKRFLQITDSGKLLYRRAKEILSLTDKASSEILSMSRGMTGTISIGIVGGSAPDIAAEWIERFSVLHPQVRFRIMDGNSDDLISKLRSGIISLAVITSPCDNSLLNSFSAGKEKMTAFMSRENPLAKQDGDTLDLSLLKDQPLIVPGRSAIVDMIYKWFKTVGTEPRIICETDNYLDVAALAGRNVGVGIFPKTGCIPNPGIAAKEIVNPERFTEYLFVWLKGHPLPAVEEAFIDYVKYAVQKNAEETTQGVNAVS